MKLKEWLPWLVVLVFLIGGGIYSGYRKRKALKCSSPTIGKIVDKYHINTRGYFIKYQYEFDEKNYFTSESLTSKSDIKNIQIGNSINIEVSCSNHNISKMIINDAK
jgi:hypothetical protein